MQPNGVCLTVALKPLFGIHFVGTNDCANIVVQNFSSCTGKRCKASFFKCGEAVYMHVGNCRLHSFCYIDVVIAIKVGVNTALKGDFSCTHAGSFYCTICNVIER